MGLLQVQGAPAKTRFGGDVRAWESLYLPVVAGFWFMGLAFIRLGAQCHGKQCHGKQCHGKQCHVALAPVLPDDSRPREFSGRRLPTGSLENGE